MALQIYKSTVVKCFDWMPFASRCINKWYVGTIITLHVIFGVIFSQVPGIKVAILNVFDILNAENNLSVNFIYAQFVSRSLIQMLEFQSVCVHNVLLLWILFTTDSIFHKINICSTNIARRWGKKAFAVYTQCASAMYWFQTLSRRYCLVLEWKSFSVIHLHYLSCTQNIQHAYRSHLHAHTHTNSFMQHIRHGTINIRWTRITTAMKSMTKGKEKIRITVPCRILADNISTNSSGLIVTFKFPMDEYGIRCMEVSKRVEEWESGRAEDTTHYKLMQYPLSTHTHAHTCTHTHTRIM